MKKYYLLLSVILLFSSCISIKVKKQVAIDYYNIGNDYQKMKKYKEAIDSYERSLEYNPKSLDTILNLIICYQLNKDYETVEKYFTKYYNIAKYDYRRKLIMILGNNFYFQEKYTQAIKTYEEYSEAYPNDANCFFNLGLTYMKLLDDEKALEYFLKAYEIDNKHIPAIFDIADYYYLKKDYENSLYYFSLLIDLDNNNPEIFYRLGKIEFEIKEYGKAREHINKSIELNEKDPKYHILMARIYSKGYKNKSKTIDYIEKALKNDYNDIKTLKSTEEFKLLYEYEEFKNLLKKYNLK